MTPAIDEYDLRIRVRAEFREMPGLKLTPAQAARLFDLEPARCERVLDALIRDGVLALERGTYVRRDVGRRDA